MRNERGITLIALVVTIVVLLILAGVTITYALGNNGLFTNAQKAELNSELGNLRDYASIAKFDVLAKYSEDNKAFLNAEGTEDSAAILTFVKGNFPSDYTITQGSTSLSAVSGTLTGTIEVKLKTTNNPDGHTIAVIDFSDIKNITTK